MLLSEIPPQEQTSAFLGFGVVSHNPQPALALVSRCFELADEIMGAGCEGLGRDGKTDPALLVASPRSMSSTSAILAGTLAEYASVAAVGARCSDAQATMAASSRSR